MFRPLPLLKVVVCGCGFRTMADHVEVGTVYPVDLDDSRVCTLVCGGCGGHMPIEAVFVGSRDGCEPGYLPRELFAGD